MQSISIIGCGWLGLPLGQYLAEKGFPVKGSTTQKEKLTTLAAAQIEPFHLQVTADGIVGQELADFWNSDILLINLPPGRRNPNVLVDHPKQIEHILAANHSKYILYTSSTGVYSDEKPLAQENDALSPTRNSTKAIAQIEQQLQQLTDIKVIILRLAGLVGGDRQAGRFFAGKTDITDPEKPVNVVHQEDIIQIIHQIIVREEWNDVFNVCADEHPTKREFYTQQARKLNLTPPEFQDANLSKPFKIVDNTKIKTALNYQFLHPDPIQF
ncbi:MAG: SDR family oxidoreductase [Bacteroidota bacterium]